MSARLYGGINIAMKVPPHQYHATIAFYRDIVGLKPFDAKAPAVGFELGPNRLWIDEVPTLSQAEVDLERAHSTCQERLLRGSTEQPDMQRADGERT